MAEPIGPKPGSTGGNGRLSLPWEAPTTAEPPKAKAGPAPS